MLNYERIFVGVAKFIVAFLFCLPFYSQATITNYYPSPQPITNFQVFETDNFQGGFSFYAEADDIGDWDSIDAFFYEDVDCSTGQFSNSSDFYASSAYYKLTNDGIGTITMATAQVPQFSMAGHQINCVRFHLTSSGLSPDLDLDIVNNFLQNFEAAETPGSGSSTAQEESPNQDFASLVFMFFGAMLVPMWWFKKAK